jgi:hypothetical protein
VHQQHCHDPQKLTKQTSFHFLHQNSRTAVPTKLLYRRPFGLAGNESMPSRHPPFFVAGHAPPPLLEHITHHRDQ